MVILAILSVFVGADEVTHKVCSPDYSKFILNNKNNNLKLCND